MPETQSTKRLLWLLRALTAQWVVVIFLRLDLGCRCSSMTIC